MNLLLFCLQTSLICLAVHKASEEGGVLFFVRSFSIRLQFHGWINTILYDCLPCMASLYTVTMWLLEGMPLSLHIILAILITSGLNVVLSLLLSVNETLMLMLKERWDE